MIKTSSIIGAAALLVAGCQSAGHDRFVEKMNGFIGTPESTVTRMYGPPQSSYVLADGSRVISYTRSGQVMLPGASYSTPVTTNTYGTVNVPGNMQQLPMTAGYNQTSTTYVQQQAAPTKIVMSCTVNFTVSSGGMVQDWSASGNHCVAN